MIFVQFQLYSYVAEWLTNLECPRTFTDYEDSYTFKVFLFQFINYYSSLFYIAFVKVYQTLIIYSIAFRIICRYIENTARDNSKCSIFVLFQGNFYKDPRTNDGFEGDECDPSGCFYELALNLIIITVSYTPLTLPTKA